MAIVVYSRKESPVLSLDDPILGASQMHGIKPTCSTLQCSVLFTKLQTACVDETCTVEYLCTRRKAQIPFLAAVVVYVALIHRMI